MDLEPLTKLAITASVLLLVFALGLRVTIGEATYLFRRPTKFARALLAMYVIVPAAILLFILVAVVATSIYGKRSAGPA